MKIFPDIPAFKIRLITGSFILLLFVFISCTSRNEKQTNDQIFQNNTITAYAERFKLEKKGGYSLLTIINPWQGASEVNYVWYLVNRGSKLPSGIDSSKVIYVPIRKIVCMSTTHISMISALNEANTISGVSGAPFLYEKNLIERLENGLIADVGYDDNLNKEMLISISPDLVMVYGIGHESAGYIGKIRELGIKVLFNADYLETDPLGKAEWIKMFGALFCKENLADEIFQSIEKEYNRLKYFIYENSVDKPDVLLGLPYRDTWYISPGNSYISRLITDAGGNYLWKETKSSISMPIGIENVYLKGINADYWLNIGSINSRKEISAIDPRLEDFPCFKNGNLYNNNKRTDAKGANDYWESGCLNPHIILKDIANILHPELFSDHELFYYRKID